MKKKVIDFVKHFSKVPPRYSGHTKTLYIENNYEIHSLILAEFGYNLPFKIDIL